MSANPARLGAAAVRAIAATALLATTLAACATPPTDPVERAAFEKTNDPLEPTNRVILDANMVFDKFLLRPAAKVYVTIVPEEGRDAFRHVLDNLKEPVLVINNVLQGRLDSAGISVGRFAINSTIGVVGLFDVARNWGLERQPADFGQTLYVWGLPEGPYLVLPIFGPSNPRDAIGMGVDAYMDPFSYLATRADLDEIQIGRFVLDGIDQRARVLDILDDLQRNSLDFYAQLRSLSQQNRAAELRRGAPPPPEPNFYTDPGNSGASPPAEPSSGTTPAATPAGTPSPPAAAPAPAGAAKPSAARTPRHFIVRRVAELPPPPGRKPLVPPPAGVIRSPAPPPLQPSVGLTPPDEGPLRASPRP